MKNDKVLQRLSFNSNRWDNSQIKLCIVTNTFADDSGQEVLHKLLRGLEPISEKIFVITGAFKSADISEKVKVISLKPHEDKLTSLKILKYIMSQIKICFTLLKVYKDIDLVVFYINSTGLILPLILSKILKKKVVLIVSALDSKMARMIYKDYMFGIGKEIIFVICKTFEKISCHFSDKIIIDSEELVGDLGLDGYGSKVTVANERKFIDVDVLTVKKTIEERKNLIGYIGRLSYEKGAMNFVRAIPLVLRERDDLEFLIGGDGPLLIEIENVLKKTGIQDKVNFLGWIPHSKLADWLNELKLLIVPSYTEGLPNIALEAMACGTPVLATPVGAIPDVIEDGETGFILENNTPDYIASRIIEALSYPYQNKIVKNARVLIEKKFPYEATVEMYRNILYSLAEE